MIRFSYDIIGDIAILKFSESLNLKEKRKIANDFLKQYKNIKTVLEKSDRIKGRLRIAKTDYLAGENKKETIHNENGCRFKLNINETYFSPRLSNQRQIIAKDLVRRITENKNKILVMFAGIAPFPIVIAKKLKKAGKQAEIISNELNRNASRYAEENIKINKLGDYIRVVQGDAKKLSEKLKSKKLSEKFDFIIMPRPNLKETFLSFALKLSKPKTRFYYYGFGKKQDVLNEIKKEIGRKIGKINIKKAGEIAPYKYRWLAEFVKK